MSVKIICKDVDTSQWNVLYKREQVIYKRKQQLYLILPNNHIIKDVTTKIRAKGQMCLFPNPWCSIDGNELKASNHANLTS